MSKPKSKKRKLYSNLTEKRILQLSNDLSEGIASGTVQDWRAVALYFRVGQDNAHADINSIRPTVAAMVTGLKMVAFAREEMDGWLKRVQS